MIKRIGYPTAAEVFDSFNILPRFGNVLVESEEETLEAEFAWQDVYLEFHSEESPLAGYRVELNVPNDKEIYAIDGKLDANDEWGEAHLVNGSRIMGKVQSVRRI